MLSMNVEKKPTEFLHVMQGNQIAIHVEAVSACPGQDPPNNQLISILGKEI